MNTTKRDPPEVRERAVRLVVDQQGPHPSLWAAIGSMAGKIGCTPEPLRKWPQEAVQAQRSPKGSITEHQRLRERERENRELKRANEILRKAAAFFAQAELDRKRK